MDLIAIISGVIGVIVFSITVVVAAYSGSYYPLIFGFVFMAIAIAWRYLVLHFTEQQSKEATQAFVAEYEGKDKMAEMKELIEAFEGERPVQEGAELYIKTIKYYLSKVGVTGLTHYSPRNYQTFENYGLFIMEIEKDYIWHRPQMYAILSIAGPHAGKLIGQIYRANWDQVMDYIAEQGNIGLLPAKHMEIKSPLVKAAMENSMRQQLGGA